MKKKKEQEVFVVNRFKNPDKLSESVNEKLRELINRNMEKQIKKDLSDSETD